MQKGTGGKFLDDVGGILDQLKDLFTVKTKVDFSPQVWIGLGVVVLLLVGGFGGGQVRRRRKKYRKARY